MAVGGSHRETHGRMDGWMDGWIDGWTQGQVSKGLPDAQPAGLVGLWLQLEGLLSTSV